MRTHCNFRKHWFQAIEICLSFNDQPEVWPHLLCNDCHNDNYNTGQVTSYTFPENVIHCIRMHVFSNYAISVITNICNKTPVNITKQHNVLAEFSPKSFQLFL